MHTMGTQHFILNERWLLDETADQLVDLSDARVAIHLKPIVTRLFGLLVRSPGVVLSRRKLFDEGWRRHGFEVCDNSLSQAICALRAVLDSLGVGAPSIKTLPRIGYALLADIRALPSQPHRCPDPIGINGGQMTDNGATTPLWHRESFIRALDSEWRRAQRSGLPLSLLLVAVNEGTTSLEATTAVTCVAECIRRRIRRAGDLASRYTDDTFAILLPGTEARGATTVAQAVAAAVQDIMPSGHVTMQACGSGHEHASSQAWIDAVFDALYVGHAVGTADSYPIPAPAKPVWQVAA